MPSAHRASDAAPPQRHRHGDRTGHPTERGRWVWTAAQANGDDDVRGGRHDDTVKGGDGWDMLRGGTGDDVDGGRGHDSLPDRESGDNVRRVEH